MNKKKIAILGLASASLAFSSLFLLKTTSSKNVVRASADLVISSDEDMASFIASCNAGTHYTGQTVSLENDVSISLTAKPLAADPYSIFDGTFEGNNHTINLTIDTNDTACGLWRNVGPNGIVKDFTITGTVRGSTYASPIGCYNNGIIRNVTSSVTMNIPTVDQIGGLVYRNNVDGKIYDCTFNGSISGAYKIGGIAGKNQGLIEGCVNRGSILGTGQYLAGITPEQDLAGATLRNCVNYGNIATTSADTGAGFAGGIIGVAGTNTTFVSNIIEGCVNYADLNFTRKDIAGIAGFIYPNTKIRYCCNYGDIVGNSSDSGTGVGGIVGRINGSCSTAGASTEIIGCYNGGDITSGNRVGGILGICRSSVKPQVIFSDNFDAGDVYGTDSSKVFAGTLCGWANITDGILESNCVSVGQYHVSSGASEYGYGVASGAAKSAASKMAEGVSADFKEIVKIVNEYNCELRDEIVDDLTAYLGSLSSDEQTLLSSIAYKDILTTYSQKDYLSAAQYIIGYIPAAKGNPVGALFNAVKDNGSIILFVIIGLSIATVAFALVNRRRTLRIR